MANNTLNKIPRLANVTEQTLVPGANADGILGGIDLATLGTVIGVATSVAYKGAATAATNPNLPTPPDDPQYYSFSTAGTYTNFKDQANASIVVNANEAGNLSFNGTYWTKQVIPVDLSNYATTAALSTLQNQVNTVITPGTEMATNLQNGFLNSAGVFTASANWRATDYINVTEGTQWQYKGLTSGSSYAVMGYNNANTFITAIFTQVDYHLAYQLFTIPTGVTKIRASARMLGGDVFSLLSPALVQSVNVAGMPALQATVSQNQTNLSYLVSSFNYATTPSLGYIAINGTFVAAANWRATPFVAVKAGDIIQYQGNASLSAVAVVGYDSSQAFHSIIYDQDETATLTDITIPSGISYIRASGRMLAGDVFVANVINFKIASSSSGGTEDIAYFAPKVAWAKQGDLFRMYPAGIVGKNNKDRHIDVITDMINSNEEFIEYSPAGADNDKVIKTYLRGLDGGLTLMGNTTVKITHVAQSPASAVNVICLGDSLTLGTTSSGIQGAYPNEFSRRLTGTGTALMTGGQSPAALALTNIYFRGTLGNQPVKHEGRGGWGINTYLTAASSGSDTNAFWNPGTLQFDLNYYLTTYNFNAAQTTGGVDATGSNLVIYLFLGWNHVYTGSLASAQTSLNTMLDLIHAQKSACKIKLMGMQTPPDRNVKPTRGNVSPEQVMREAIIPYAEAWQASAEARSSWVEFVPIAPFFHPEGCYPTTNKPIHLRSATTYAYNTDYVHPNAAGYSQIADTCYYNFLYNYCRQS
jgi:lysophospholipase L1-like esterase